MIKPMQKILRSKTVRLFFSIIMVGEIIATAGCATKNSSVVVRKSSKEREAMEVEVQKGRNLFFENAFPAAEKNINGFAAEQHVNKPLYECELASVALLSGDKKKVQAHLKEAIRLLDVLYDAKSEKEAASLWGKESAKVYKGDPYERALLYTFYGLMLLEDNDVDNALASFKRALLMDGDTKERKYQSDFALVQLLAAKCYELRKENDMRDIMLKEAYRSFISFPGARETLLATIKREYEFAKRENVLHTKGLNPSLLQYFSWGGVEAVTQELSLDQDVTSWIKQHAKPNNLDFNTLLIGWQGRGPKMYRTGEYGEIRMISPGFKDGDMRQQYSAQVMSDSRIYDAIPLLGDVSYQATTRGGRQMDNVLRNQALIKKTMAITGDSLITAGFVTGLARSTGNSNSEGAAIVALSLILLAITIHVVASQIYSDADVRNWRCLPYELNIFPVKIPSGKQEVYISSWLFASPVAAKMLTVEHKEDRALTYIHFVSPHNQSERIPGVMGDFSETYLQDALISHPELDSNGDFEISPSEFKEAMKAIMKQYDVNKDSFIDRQESELIKKNRDEQLDKRMGR